jgi:hypothetical protein
MSILKIKEAIEKHNEKRSPGEPRMTQRSLSEYVFENLDEAQAEFYISRWCNDKSLTKMQPLHIIRICIKTGVSPNFLFDWAETEL